MPTKIMHEIASEVSGILWRMPELAKNRGASNTPATIVNCHVPETSQPGP